VDGRKRKKRPRLTGNEQGLWQYSHQTYLLTAMRESGTVRFNCIGYPFIIPQIGGRNQKNSLEIG
jgi:hypothetical protein